MKTSKKIISLLMCMLMVLSIVPIMPGALQKAHAEELTKISSLEATSTFADKMKVGKTVPGSGSFGLPVVTVGQPAIVNPNMMFEVYKKNEGGVFSKVSSNTPVEPGIYQFKTYVSLIQGQGYELDPAMTVTIDGKTCTHNGIITVRNVKVDTITITSGEYEVVAPPELVFTDSTNLDIPMGEVDKPIKSFSVATYVNGGTAPYTFSKKSGPEWITVSSNGTVSGTPTQVVDANEDLVVQVNDSTDPVQTAEISISVGKTYSPEAVTYVNLAYISLDNIFNIGNTVTIPSNSDVKVSSSSLSDSTVIAISNDIGESPKWQKFENNVWTDLTSADVFERGGTYKLKGISFYADYTKVKFDEDIVVYVNGKEWNITYNGRNPGYGYVDIESPELILREELKKENVTLNLDVYTYDGSAKEPTAIVKNADNEVLVEGTDYTVTYINNINEGVASVIITGEDEYEGEIIKTFTINPCPHAYDNACDATCNKCESTRTPAAHKGGTATCKAKAKCSVCGEAYGSLKAHSYKTVTTKATLTKNGKVESKCSVCGYVSKTTTVYYPKTFKLSATEYTYNKKTKTPTVTVKDSKGNTLKKDTDYTVSYESGRKYPGEYTVKITFKGKYEGTKRLYFTIAPRVTSKITATQTTSTITLKWSKVTGADGYRVYKYNSKTKKYEKLKDVTSTSLKISKLKEGTAYKYKVRAYTKDDGTIYGEYSKAFETATKCKTPSITKLTTTKGTASYTWSNVAGESGYQVYYSTKKDSGYKKVASYKTNVVKGSKSKLTSGKTYYFKVRAYTKTDSGTVYSAWSSVKSVKVK